MNWLGNLFTRQMSSGSGPMTTADAAAPAGETIYAVGDIHGTANLFDALMAQILQDLRMSPLKAHLIILGDMIDRGPDSSGVVQRILTVAAEWPGKGDCIALKGNHEAALLAFLDHPNKAGPSWLAMGGSATLSSYGVALPKLSPRGSFDGLRNALLASMPNSHLRFFTGLGTSVSMGDYFFCHGGARSGVPLHRQKPEDLINMRQRPHQDPSYEKIIVHGHSPNPTPQKLKHRINIDTGAYITGRLTAVKLVGNRTEFIQTQGGLSSHDPSANEEL